MFTEVFILNFLGVGLADRGNVIGVDNAALHEVYGIKEFQIAVVEVFPIQPQNIRHDVLREHALIFEVVDGVERLDVLIALIFHVLQFQEHIDKACMPVVGMNDIRPEIHCGQEVQHSPAEEGETLGIIIIAVESFTVEIFLIIDEIIGNIFQNEFVQADVLAAPGNFQFTVIDMFHAVDIFLANRAVFRHDDADIHIFLQECFGQGPGYICQAARFDKRYCFRCYIKNFHFGFPP